MRIGCYWRVLCRRARRLCSACLVIVQAHVQQRGIGGLVVGQGFRSASTLVLGHHLGTLSGEDLDQAPGDQMLIFDDESRRAHGNAHCGFS
jgi:hypothetical protein